eukprot:g41218.t1
MGYEAVGIFDGYVAMGKDVQTPGGTGDTLMIYDDTLLKLAWLKSPAMMNKASENFIPNAFVLVTSGAKEYGPFCGDSAPVIRELLSNEVEITFHTDGQGERKGWKIMYKSTVKETAELPWSGLHDLNTVVDSSLPPGQLAKQCPTYILEHNVIQPNKSEYDYKDHVQLSCDAGYELY